MANWQEVQQGLARGYLTGRSTGGGRLGQLGSLIKGVADQLRTQRETGEATNKELGLLGVKGLISGNLERADEGGFQLPGVGRVRSLANKPQPIVDREGNIKNYRPKGSVFEQKEKEKGLTLSAALGIIKNPMTSFNVKKKYPNLYKEAESIVMKNLGKGVLDKINVSKDNSKSFLDFFKKKKEVNVPNTSNIMDTNW